MVCTYMSVKLINKTLKKSSNLDDRLQFGAYQIYIVCDMCKYEGENFVDIFLNKDYHILSFHILCSAAVWSLFFVLSFALRSSCVLCVFATNKMEKKTKKKQKIVIEPVYSMLITLHMDECLKHWNNKHNMVTIIESCK